MKVDDRKFVNAYFPWNEDLAREAKSEKPHYDPVKEKPVEMAKFEYSIEIACALDDLNSYQVGAFSLRQTKEETNISSWKKSQNDKGFTVLTASVKVNEPKTLTREFFISSGNGVSFNEVKPVQKGDGSSSESFVPIKPSIQIYNRLSWPKVGFFYHFINDELENEYQLSGGNKWSFKVTNSKGKTLSDELLSEHEYAFILLPWKIDNTVISRQHLLYTKEKITPEQFSDINAQWLDENARLINPEDVIKARNDEKIKREISDNGRVVYTVKSGDSLSLIAKNQGVKYENLLTLNPQITDPNLIQVGDLITLKEEKTEQEIVMFHVCKINPETEQRETWGEIAAQYGMAAKALFDLNTNNPMFKDGALALGNELLVNQDVQSEKEDIVYRNAQSPESITSDKSVFSFSNIWSVIEQPYSTLAYMFAQNDAAISNNTAVVNVKSVLLHSNMLATSESLEMIAQEKAPSLKKGDNGNEVKVIQEALLALNFDLGKSGADGDFGSGTHQAVMDFQREFVPTNELHSEYDLKEPDGIVGSQTLLALDEAVVGNWIFEKLDSYNWADSSFGNVLGFVESKNDYSAYNRTKGGLKAFFNTGLMTFTVSEVMKKQKERSMFAVGRFQVITSTLNEAVESLSIDITSLFDKAIQDRIFNEYLISKKRPQIMSYLEGNGRIEDAMYAWAKEFASAGVEKGKKISQNRIAEGGESYYAGDGLNKAHLTPDKMKETLMKAKQERFNED
jgi:hypothetical protein